MTCRPNKLSGGVVPVRFENHRPLLLLLRAYRNWDFPKGEVEPDEVPLETARRELEEETGLTSATFRWGEDFCETRPYAGGKVARYYLARCDVGEVMLPVNPELGRPEHHEFRWVSLDEAERLIPDRLRPILAWVRTRIRDDP